MAKSCETLQIKKEFLSYDIALLICAMSELHPLLVQEKLGLRHGLVIFLENRREIDELEDLLCASGATLCRSFKRPVENICNTEFAIHNYTKYDKESAVVDFLESGFFLPVVVTCGFVPEFLKETSNIIVLEDFHIDGLQTQNILKDIEGFRTYVREYPPGIQQKLKNFKTSNVFLQNKHLPQLNLLFMAIIDIFSDFYRCTHDESECNEMKIRLIDSSTYFCRLSEHYADGWDISDAIKNTIYEFIDEHMEIAIGDIKEIEGTILSAVEKECAILYDTKYYYFPEKVLRMACAPLLDEISFPNLKSTLLERQILNCNNITTRNYTVKKLLTNAYGKIFRMRFLKLKRDFFATPDTPALEERREANRCLSEILTKNHA